MTDLGPRLKAARKAKGWTLRKAGRQSGVPNAHVSQVETGAIRNPGLTVLIRLGAAYGIPLTELLALAGRADFGVAGEDGRLEDHEGHDLWRMSVYLPEGREAEAAAWMAAHGLEVYRMQRVSEMMRGDRG
jgi:transcriptional regulator with XRE-family HTH domain